MLIENLRIAKVIVHEAPVASEVKAGSLPTFGTEPLELGVEGEECLCERLTTALGKESHSFELSVRDFGAGSTFQVCAALLEATPALFVAQSKALAQKLTSAQVAGGVNSGLAVVITAKATVNSGESRMAIVLKAEGDTGFKRGQVDGKLVFQFLNDVFLGRHQRLYKIGCFIETTSGAPDDEGSRDTGDFKVLVFDQQMSADGNKPAAQYFFQTFLGCQIAENARRQTKAFFDASRDSIRELAIPVVERIGYLNDLTAYMRSQKATVSTTDFADEFLKKEHATSFKKSMKARKIETRAIVKDTTAIASKLRERRVGFSSNVKITAPAEVFGSSVQILETQEGWTTVKIAGTVEES